MGGGDQPVTASQLRRTEDWQLYMPQRPFLKGACACFTNASLSCQDFGLDRRRIPSLLAGKRRCARAGSRKVRCDSASQ